MVTVALHRRTPRGSQIIDAVVDSLGWTIGRAERCLPFLPGLGGAALVSWGAAQVFTPAGWILGGCFLVLADRQIRLKHQRAG